MPDLQNLQLGASSQVVGLVNTVGHDDLVKGAGVDPIDGVATQNAVCHQGVDAGSALLLQELGGASDGVRRVRKVIDEDGGAILDISDQHHGGILAVCDLGGAALLQFVRLAGKQNEKKQFTNLVNQRKLHPHGIGDSGSSFGTTGIGADHNGVLVVGDVPLDVGLEKRTSIQVVHRDVEETLVLRIVQIHRDDMVRTGASEQVGHQGTGLSDPLLVARAWLEVVDLDCTVIGTGESGVRLGGLEGITAGEPVDRALLDGTAIADIF